MRDFITAFRDNRTEIARNEYFEDHANGVQNGEQHFRWIVQRQLEN